MYDEEFPPLPSKAAKAEKQALPQPEKKRLRYGTSLGPLPPPLRPSSEAHTSTRSAMDISPPNQHVTKHTKYFQTSPNARGFERCEVLASQPLTEKFSVFLTLNKYRNRPYTSLSFLREYGENGSEKASIFDVSTSHLGNIINFLRKHSHILSLDQAKELYAPLPGNFMATYLAKAHEMGENMNQ